MPARSRRVTRWIKSWTHAWREARYRTSATWAEFVDWLHSTSR